jgi:signal transduction histidine kinase/ligand-binding sensor domain-containing protein
MARLFCVGMILIGRIALALPSEHGASRGAPSQSLFALNHTVFTHQQGAPRQSTAIAQTSDGYLWFATDTGVARFDGVRFEEGSVHGLPPRSPLTLHADTDNNLWVGFNFGALARIHDGNATFFEGNGVPPGSIFSILETPDGVLWAISTKGISKFIHNRWLPLEPDMGYAPKRPLDAFVTPDGAMWIMDPPYFFVLKKGARQFIKANHSEANVARWNLPPDSTWLPAQGENFAYGDGITDSTGAYWLIRTKEGINRYRWPKGDQAKDPALEHMGRMQGLGGDHAYALFEDNQGDVWVTTNNGVDRFRANKLTAFPLRPDVTEPTLAFGDNQSLWIGGRGSSPYQVTDQLSGEYIQPLGLGSTSNCMYRDANGVIWTAGLTGTHAYDHGKVIDVPLPPTLKSWALTRVQSMAVDAEGALWQSFATASVFRLKDNKWIERGGYTELPNSNALRIINDAQGRLWLTYPDNVIALIQHDRARIFTTTDGLNIGTVTALYARGDHAWAGGDGGLELLKNDHFFKLHGKHGESFTAVSGVVETSIGELWLYASNVIYRITKEEVSRVLADPTYGVSYEYFDDLDGLVGDQPTIRPLPSLQEGPDGKIWIASLDGLFWIDPSLTHREPSPARTYIQTVTADGHVYPPSENVVLPKLTRNIRIRYTSPVLSIPERARFRYRLEGVDGGWQDAGSRREAFYTRLPPGKYSFDVAATNAEGIWSDKVATSNFSVAAAWYQTQVFVLSCSALGLIVLAWLYRFRIRQLTARERGRLEERLIERERIARDLHDTLLQGLLGSSLQLALANDQIPPGDAAKPLVVKVLKLLRQMIDEARDAVSDLRNLSSTDSDLRIAFSQIPQNLAIDEKIEYRLIIEGTPRLLHPLIQDEVYRIGREALLNAFRHSHASLIELTVDYASENLHLIVRDNGRGIQPEILRSGREGHWGLSGMRERSEKMGAKLNVVSVADEGTKIDLSIPAIAAYEAPTSRVLMYWSRLFHSLKKR